MECLQTYFEYKKMYDERNYKLKREIYFKAKSKKDARMKMAALKPKCMNCSRPVGSIFQRDGRNYIARCGDMKHPCNFHIHLFGGEYGKVNSSVNYYKDGIEITKEYIIIDKLQVLFNFMSESDGVDFFKENLDNFTKENMQFTTLKREYDELYFNEEREEKIQQKMTKIKGIQDRIGELYSLYKQDNNPDVLKDATTIYLSELVPEMENLQLIKYDIREMNHDEKTGISELFQRPWRLNQIEYTFGEYPKVIKFRLKR
jgi:hypothetical protein